MSQELSQHKIQMDRVIATAKSTASQAEAGLKELIQTKATLETDINSGLEMMRTQVDKINDVL